MKVAFLTHEPFYPPSGGGSAEAIYLVQEFVERKHELHLFCPKVAEPDRVRREFGVHLHEFTTWQMGRYTAWRNFKYLLYPFFLEAMVARAAGDERFDLVFSQHAIAAVAAGRLKKRLGVPVITNFLDYLTGFMET
jgi:UDP-N-acetylglucosamine:LPS N-acetylglucosamine transferase